MARGAIAKEKLTKAITTIFKNSFVNGKEIRVPIDDGGEIVEIKISLTAAKDSLLNMSNGSFEVELGEKELIEYVANLTDEEKNEIIELLNLVEKGE